MSRVCVLIAAIGIHLSEKFQWRLSFKGTWNHNFYMILAVSLENLRETQYNIN